MQNNEKAIAATNTDRHAMNLSSTSHSTSSNKITPQQLLQALDLLPTSWALVAVGRNKAPLGTNWQKIPLTKQDFEVAVQDRCFERLTVEKDGKSSHPPISWFHAVGVLCGSLSGGLLFLDHDGPSCDEVICKLSGQSLEQALPTTVSVTSGREGRYQSVYRVPERFWGAIATKKISTGVTGEDGKPEQLEFRWEGSQSVVSGYHPLTGAYKWLPNQAPNECDVADAPTWMIEVMLEDTPIYRDQSKLQRHNVWQEWGETDWALSYLSSIPSTEDYKAWIEVGMALHSVSEHLLSHWDEWSRGAANYEIGVCARHWKSFKQNGVGIGTLGLLAKQNGWRSPFRKNGSDRNTYTYNPSKRPKDRQQTLPECSASEDDEDLAEEIQSLLKLKEEVAPVQSLLSPRLRIPFLYLANQFNVPLESFFGVLLPVAASLLRAGTCLEIDPNTGFRPPAILWMGLVGPSGSTKSPIFNTLLNPLEKLQADADIAYQIDFALYKQELDEYEKRPKGERGCIPTGPIQREYYLQDATSEGIAACLGGQPDRGTIFAVDELASLCAGFNQYRAQGKGNDRQKWLSLYDGKSIKVNRKTGPRIFVPKTALSLTGTIQPCVLQKQMESSGEVDGLWSRFLWILLPLTKMPPPGDGPNYNLFCLLQALYKALESLPCKIYQLDHKGREVWKEWHNLCEAKKVSESNSVLVAIHPKAKERAARIAVVAHCINAVAEDRIPESIVSSEILEAAIEFTKWSVGQARLIYADSGNTIHHDSSEIARLIKHFKDEGWIKARHVTHWSSSKKKLKADAARALMKRVVALGYGVDNGKNGKEYQICIKDRESNTSNNVLENGSASGIEASNIGGNKLVTNGATDLDSYSDKALRESSVGVVPDKTIQEQLLKVTSVVTSSQHLPNKESEALSYQVTTPFKVGDRVVLKGDGNQQPTTEVKTIWIVQKNGEQGVTVYDEALGHRTFPIEWLALYQSSGS